MQPHYSESSRENATPSSGTSPLVSYKEVPPRGNSYIKVTGMLFVSLMSENCSLWSLLLSGQKANIQLVEPPYGHLSTAANFWQKFHTLTLV